MEYRSVFCVKICFSKNELTVHWVFMSTLMRLNILSSEKQAEKAPQSGGGGGIKPSRNLNWGPLTRRYALILWQTNELEYFIYAGRFGIKRC